MSRLLALDGVSFYALVLFAAQGIGLFRFFVVARQLGDEIQGEVVILGMVVSFFATVLVLNTAWQLVQSDNFNESGFQSTLQGVALFRGIATGIVIAVAGYMLLGAMGIPELQGPLLVLAFLPLIEGLVHLDAWRGLRTKNFRQLAIIEISPSLISLVVALLLLVFFRSVWVYVFVSITGSFVKMVATHVVAKRAFSARIHRKYVREIIRFTLPLLPAGMFFWLNGQSDRIVLLLEEGAGQLALLGAYGTIAMICVIPIAPLSKLIYSVVVPALARFKHDIPEFRRYFLHVYLRVCLGVAVVVLGAGIGAESTLELILGPDFKPGAVVAPILVTAAGLQLSRGLVYQLGVARGDTRVQLVGNLARLSGIGFAILALQQGFGITGLAMSVLLAEVCSLFVSSVFLGWTAAPVTRIIVSGTLGILSVFLVAYCINIGIGEWEPGIRISLGLSVGMAALLIFYRIKVSGTLKS